MTSTPAHGAGVENKLFMGKLDHRAEGNSKLTVSDYYKYGGILTSPNHLLFCDSFPSEKEAVRIELFEDEIENLAYFDLRAFADLEN